jgi:hypothetical protein
LHTEWWHDFVQYQPSSASSDGTSIQTGHTNDSFFRLTCFLREIFIHRQASDSTKLSGPVERPAHVFQVSLPAVFDAASNSASYSSWDILFVCWDSMMLIAPRLGKNHHAQ